MCRLRCYHRRCVCHCAGIEGRKEGGEDVVDRIVTCLLEKWIMKRTAIARMKGLEDEYGVPLKRWRAPREGRGLV